MVLTSYGIISDASLIYPHFPNTPYINFDTSLTFENLPAKLTPKLAYFVGYFFGDGGVKDIQKTFKKRRVFEYKIMIADEFEFQMKIIQNLFFDLFGIKPPIRYERILKGERTYYINPTNKSVYLFLTTIFGFSQSL